MNAEELPVTKFFLEKMEDDELTVETAAEVAKMLEDTSPEGMVSFLTHINRPEGMDPRRLSSWHCLLIAVPGYDKTMLRAVQWAEDNLLQEEGE